MTQQSGKKNRYKIISRLCSGGMADIYLGVRLDQRLLERFVAIKKIHNMNSGEQNEKFRMMFADEARIISTLSHPHIVQIFDFTEKGENFHIIMEYIDGENLGYVLNMLRRREERIPLDIGIRLMAQALEALQYIHTATSLTGQPLNIVHRDLDPRNLMVDSNGYLKIIDFGVARTVVQTDMTAPDMFKGKLSHVAPEVFTESDIDLRADIYSLGLVLFEIVTGQRPYQFEKSSALADTIQRIISDPLPSPRNIRSDIPEELAQIIETACAKNRQMRYQSADELHIALTRFANNTEYGCGVATNGRIKEWFNDKFQERLTRRRNFESNALMKARQTLESNGQDFSSVSSLTARERLKYGSLAPATIDSDCQVTGIESLSGASFATGLMERVATTSSSVRSHSGISSSAFMASKSSPGQSILATPSSVGSFGTTPPLTLGAPTGAGSTHRLANNSHGRFMKVAIGAGGIAIAASAVLVFALWRNSTNANSTTDRDGRELSDGMITATVPILTTSSDPSRAADGESHDMQGSTDGDFDSEASRTKADARKSGNRSSASNRSWTKRRPTHRTTVSQTSKELTDTGRGVDDAMTLDDESVMEYAQDDSSPNVTSSVKSLESAVALTAASKPVITPTLTDTPKEAPAKSQAVPTPTKTEKPAAPQYMSGSGDWSGVQVAKTGCGSCHSVKATSKTSSQWEYFFSHNRHRSNANLKALFSKTELRRVESYLISIVEKSKTNNSGIAGIR